jgi:hypothetical protein
MTMTNADSTSKITPEHRARKAVVYLRQSSPTQVKHNTESQRLQYALKDSAKAFGFARVEVIDRDLGMSAAIGAQPRAGFKQLLASIALGEVGLVLSRELSVPAVSVARARSGKRRVAVGDDGVEHSPDGGVEGTGNGEGNLYSS